MTGVVQRGGTVQGLVKGPPGNQARRGWTFLAHLFRDQGAEFFFLALMLAIGGVIGAQSDVFREEVGVLGGGIGEDFPHRINIPEAVLAIGRDVMALAPFVPIVEQQHAAAQLLPGDGVDVAGGFAQQRLELLRRDLPDGAFIVPAAPCLRHRGYLREDTGLLRLADLLHL